MGSGNAQTVHPTSSNVLLVWRNTPTRHWYQPAYICCGNAPTMHPGYINVHRILCHTPGLHRYPLCTCAKAMHWPGTTPLLTGYEWRNDSNWYRYWYTFIILPKNVIYVRLVTTILFQSTGLMCVHGLWLGLWFINVSRVWNSYDVMPLLCIKSTQSTITPCYKDMECNSECSRTILKF